MRQTIEDRGILRKRALESRDAVRYAFLCDDIGIPEHSIEDWELYERGHDIIAIETISDSRTSSVKSVVVDDIDNSSYAALTRLALRRFPAGHVSVRELRQRASQINRVGAAVGYHLKTYSDMGRDELFSYLTGEVHRDVTVLAREHCSKTLAQVMAGNSRQKWLETNCP